MTIRARRLISAGALAVAAVAAPLALAGGVTHAVAGPCLAQVTSQGSDPVCVGYSNGTPTNVGTPWGIYGPNGSAGGIGGPMLPGQTWRTPIA